MLNTKAILFLPLAYRTYISDECKIDLFPHTNGVWSFIWDHPLFIIIICAFDHMR